MFYYYCSSSKNIIVYHSLMGEKLENTTLLNHFYKTKNIFLSFLAHFCFLQIFDIIRFALLMNCNCALLQIFFPSFVCLFVCHRPVDINSYCISVYFSVSLSDTSLFVIYFAHTDSFSL